MSVRWVKSNWPFNRIVGKLSDICQQWSNFSRKIQLQFIRVGSKTDNWCASKYGAVSQDEESNIKGGKSICQSSNLKKFLFQELFQLKSFNTHIFLMCVCPNFYNGGTNVNTKIIFEGKWCWVSDKRGWGLTGTSGVRVGAFSDTTAIQ